MKSSEPSQCNLKKRRLTDSPSQIYAKILNPHLSNRSTASQKMSYNSCACKFEHGNWEWKLGICKLEFAKSPCTIMTSIDLAKGLHDELSSNDFLYAAK